MRRSSSITLVVLLLLGGLFAWILWGMLQQRFSSGADYSPYSVQRVDPLGAKALMEALDRLPHVEAKASFTQLDKLQGQKGTALILLNVPDYYLKYGYLLKGKALYDFAAKGGRVIVAINGNPSSTSKVVAESEEHRIENAKKRFREKQALREDSSNEKKETPKDTAPQNAGDPDSGKEKERELRRRPVSELSDEDLEYVLRSEARSTVTQFGLEVVRADFILTDRGGYAFDSGADLPMPTEAQPDWYSKTWLDLKNRSWQALASIQGKPVLASRRIGSGELIVATDSYFASNEALWKEPKPAFLTWLIGPAKTVLFDETHLGTSVDPGIMHLARQYGLHGLFIGGIIVFALFVWQSSTSLVPQDTEAEAPSRAIAGQGASAGLVSLLRRGITRKELLSRCFTQWRQSIPAKNTALQHRADLAQTLIPSLEGKSPPPGKIQEIYRRICETLHPKRY